MSLIHLRDLAGLFDQFKLHADPQSTAVTLNVWRVRCKQPSLCTTRSVSEEMRLHRDPRVVVAVFRTVWECLPALRCQSV